MNDERSSVLSLLYCYAEADEYACRDLDKHLSTLKGLERIETWSEKDILPGQDRQREYSTRLQAADIVLLFISPDFLASEICQRTVQSAIELHEQGKAFVIPILLRPVDWEGAAFSIFQPLPTTGVPITLWSHTDEAFEHVAHGIRLVV